MNPMLFQPRIIMIGFIMMMASLVNHLVAQENDYPIKEIEMIVACPYHYVSNSDLSAHSKRIETFDINSIFFIQYSSLQSLKEWYQKGIFVSLMDSGLCYSHDKIEDLPESTHQKAIEVDLHTSIVNALKNNKLYNILNIKLKGFWKRKSIGDWDRKKNNDIYYSFALYKCKIQYISLLNRGTIEVPNLKRFALKKSSVLDVPVNLIINVEYLEPYPSNQKQIIPKTKLRKREVCQNSNYPVNNHSKHKCDNRNVIEKLSPFKDISTQSEYRFDLEHYLRELLEINCDCAPLCASDIAGLIGEPIQIFRDTINQTDTWFYIPEKKNPRESLFGTVKYVIYLNFDFMGNLLVRDEDVTLKQATKKRRYRNGEKGIDVLSFKLPFDYTYFAPYWENKNLPKVVYQWPDMY